MKKAKSKKMDKKTEQMFRASEVGALIEHLEGKFDAVAEGQTILQEELRDFKDEMHEFKDEMHEFKRETANNFNILFEFKRETEEFMDETRSNFKTVFEYFSNLDEEIKDIKRQLEYSEDSKMDEKSRISLIERVKKLEKEVERFRVVLKLKKA